MTLDPRMMLVVTLALLLAGCGSGIGARDVDYSQQRSVSADISGSLYHGPTSSAPGMLGMQEPVGALPWQIGQSPE